LKHLSQKLDDFRLELAPSLCSVLCNPSTIVHQLCSMLDKQMGKVERLTTKLESATAELESIQQSLQDEIVSGIEKNTQIVSLNSLLMKEKQRIKRHWREKCEQLLAHEETLGATLK